MPRERSSYSSAESRIGMAKTKEGAARWKHSGARTLAYDDGRELDA